MKAIILARVSTEEQKEAGNSLPAQQDRLRSYIDRKPQLVFDKEFIFDESAYKETRKKFDEVIEYILTQKETVALCCDKVDRLSRDFLVGLPILEKLRREGKIELHFPSDNLILHKDSPATDLFHFNMAVSLAQYYSNSISDNVKRAYEKMRREGIWPSKVRLGYMRGLDKSGLKNIIPDPERAHLIARLFELYASGNYSLQTLQVEAEKIGLKSINGLKISKSCLDNIIRDSFYCGIAVSKKCLPYTHKYARIITKEIYDKCQEVREGKRTNRPKFLSKDFIFKGLLTCPNCGCLMTPEMHKKPSGLIFIYYSCTNAKGICKRIYVSEKALLEPIYRDLNRLEKITPEAQGYLVKALQQTREAEEVFHKAQIARIRNQYDQINKRSDNLLEKYLESETSITKEIYDKKHQEYRNKLQLLNIELEEYTQANHDYQNTVAVVFSMARRAKQIFESSEPSEKRAFLNFILQNPTINEKKLEYSLRYPFNLVIELADRPLGGG